MGYIAPPPPKPKPKLAPKPQHPSPRLNCRNCGAPPNNDARCAYCGTESKRGDQ
jgi:hypothetical protein